MPAPLILSAYGAESLKALAGRYAARLADGHAAAVANAAAHTRDLLPERLVVAGGVGANRRLRERLQTMAERAGVALYFPRVEFCTDNAAMIALAGLWRLKTGEREGLPIRARARWPLDAIHGAAALSAETIA